MNQLGPWFKQALLRIIFYPHRLLPAALRRNRDLLAFSNGIRFGDLLDRIQRLAGHWAGLGFQVGDRLIVDLPNSPSFIEARLAAILGGFVAVPIPPGVDEKTLGWIADFSEARGYLGPRGNHLPGLASLHLDPYAGDGEAYETALSSATPLKTSPPLSKDHLMTINFTSGTTGKPKGVMSTVSGWGWSLYYALRENRVPLREGETVLHAIPLATAGSTLILPTVLSGAKSLFLPRWCPEEAVRIVEEENVNRIFLTPTMLAEFMDAARARRANFKTLRTIIYGTEGIPLARIRKAFDLFGPILQQGYGMAEALPPISLLHPQEHAQGIRENDLELLSSAGHPTSAVQLLIFDGKVVLPPYQVGSIRLKGKTLSPGYWKQPELTEATRQDGFFVSGDVGYVDRRGYLHVLGREGRVPSAEASTAVEWLESRQDVCIAWAEEDRGKLHLHVVPSRGSVIPQEEWMKGIRGLLKDGTATSLFVHPEAPKTESYKLKRGGKKHESPVGSIQGSPF